MDDTKIDRETMGKLAGALAFICSPAHPAVAALKAAAASGTPGDIKKARALFLQLKSSERSGALAMISMQDE